MDKFPSFHEHSNGDISEIQGRLKDVQVMFLKRSVEIDFAIMKTNQGNVVLGRDFLQAMKGFIDIGKGQIRLRGAKGKYLFPRKNKNELIENPSVPVYLFAVFQTLSLLFLCKNFWAVKRNNSPS